MSNIVAFEIKYDINGNPVLVKDDELRYGNRFLQMLISMKGEKE